MYRIQIKDVSNKNRNCNLCTDSGPQLLEIESNNPSRRSAFCVCDKCILDIVSTLPISIKLEIVTKLKGLHV
jgi:hypothetical protein